MYVEMDEIIQELLFRSRAHAKGAAVRRSHTPSERQRRAISSRTETYIINYHRTRRFLINKK